jgi:hypothetical protein
MVLLSPSWHAPIISPLCPFVACAAAAAATAAMLNAGEPSLPAAAAEASCPA